MNAKLNVGEFENPGMYRHPFVYRVGDNEIIKDDYNKWAALPENLVVTRLKSAFQSDKLKSISINGKILKFEFDKERKLAIMQISYRIDRAEKLPCEGIFKSEKPFDEKEPSKMAEAMSLCMNEFITEISVKLKE